MAKTLMLEYSEELGIDLAFQKFQEELGELSRQYGQPEGGLLLLWEAGRAVGCVAVRRFSEEDGELKRMYLRPIFRGLGYGKKLLAAAVALARELGYRRLLLDTLPSMANAIHLYSSQGFYEIPPYRYNPVPGTLFFALDL